MTSNATANTGRGPTPPIEKQTTVGNYFISNYPPFSQWTAEGVERLTDLNPTTAADLQLVRGDHFRVENDDVGVAAGIDAAPALELPVRGRQSRQAPDRFPEREHLLLSHILAEQPREIPVGAGMRTGLQEHTLGRV